MAPSRKGSLSFEDVTHIVEEINEHYGRWHDESDCADMKKVLFKMEGTCPGRVDLSRFYAASLYEDRWQFSESVRFSGPGHCHCHPKLCAKTCAILHVICCMSPSVHGINSTRLGHGRTQGLLFCSRICLARKS